MVAPWKQTITINENLARELIEHKTNLSVDQLKLLDEGWDNLVYLVNEKYVFRFPRREQGVVCMQNEIALLPHIAKRVSFRLSCPEYIGLPSDLYPYPFAGYTMIPGKPLCDMSSILINDVNFAKVLSRWLKELHSIDPIFGDAELIKGEQSWRLDIRHRISRCEENISYYEEYFLEAGFDKQVLLDTIAFLSKLKFSNTKKSYLHGDLYCRHIIVDPERLLPSGLIDWGDIHVGHPGIDLAIGLIFTDDTLRIFLNSYGDIDIETIQIMLFHSFCHTMSFLPYAYEQNKDQLKQCARMVLRRAIDEIKNYNS